MGSLRHEIGKHRPFDLPEEEAYLNVMRTASVLSGAFAALFKEHGLSEPTYNALRIVRGAKPPGKTCSAIGRDMVVRVPDVTRIVDRLETMGLVTRARSDDDRRVVLVQITDAGAALLNELDHPIRALLRQLLAHMPMDDLDAMSRLLVEARAAQISS